jgi:hypothetical protein
MNSMQLPKQWELIGLFESEPVLTDPNLPWVYNGLTFSVEREGEAIEVEISPSYGQLAVELRRADGTTRLRLDLNGVERLAVDEHGDRAALVASFVDASPLRDLRLQLSPHVSVLWGIDPR